MEKHKNTALKDPEIILAAQEIKFAKILAGNDKTLRDKTLRRLQKWLNYRSQSSMEFSEGDFMRLWKGLFYCMWMSDKLLPQEECAEMIAKLVHSLNKPMLGILFLNCFLKTMINEWFGIDQLRLNKFLMLVRRVLRQSLCFIKKHDWNINIVNKFGLSLTETILNHTAVVPLGLSLHFIEIYLEELAKVSNQKLKKEIVTEFIRPFAKQMGLLKDGRVTNHIVNNIFRYLLKQSDIGIEHQEKFKAWHARGFPGGTIDAIQKVEESDNEFEENENQWEIDDMNEDSDLPKDPRAGKVDVILPQLHFDPEELVKILLSYKFDKQSITKSRKMVNRVIDEYKQFIQGDFPLGVKSVYVPTEEDLEETNVHLAAENLLNFESELIDRKLTKSEKKKLKKQNELMDDKENAENTEISSISQITDEKSNGKKRKNPIGTEKEQNSTVQRKKVKITDNDLEKFILNSEGDLFNKNTMKMNKEKKKKKKNENSIGDEKIMKNTTENELKPKNGVEKSSVYGLDDMGGVWEVTEWKLTSQNNETTNNIIKKKKTTQFKAKVKQSKLKSSLQNKNINNHDEWKTQLKDGETEIFVPSKKYQKKLTLQAKKEKKSVKDLLNDVNNKILKNKTTGDMPILVSNPFSPKSKIERNKGNIVVATKPKVKQLNSKKSTNNTSEKKVRIMLSLNKSQNNSEYQKQVLSSPVIPYDPKKQPAKPLLKKKTISSPINPFYNLNDSLLC